MESRMASTRPREGAPSGRASKARSKARRVIERPPSSQGWRTTDQEELERRCWRGRSEVTAVEPIEGDGSHFGTFRVHSASGSAYEVEIRSLTGLDNSCGCLDHQVNGLGTCKHIEGALALLRKKGARAFAAAGSLRASAFIAAVCANCPAVPGRLTAMRSTRSGLERSRYCSPEVASFGSVEPADSR